MRVEIVNEQGPVYFIYLITVHFPSVGGVLVGVAVRTLVCKHRF